MSKFTKFLALALATIMVAGMMVFTAPAAAAYAPTGDYASDIALLNALDVMLGDGVSFNEEAPVTRWQMALFIARIVTGETGNEMWEADKSAYYTDVDATDYPGAIDFCYDMGYMNGVGDNKFNPDGNIMYQDALTLLVRLLGYETEDTKYPWGHILTAQDIATIREDEFLTDDINASYRADLKREEVANLIAKALYVNRIGGYNANGQPIYKGTLMTTGLKATDLGAGTLVATYNAAIGNNNPTNDLDKVTFLVGTDLVEVDVANLTKDAEFHINDLLGFTAALVSINVKREAVVFADMDNITVVDKYGAADKAFELKDGDFVVGKTNYEGATFVKFGTDVKNVFVEAEATDAPEYGRAIICNGGNDTNVENDTVRFVEFTRTSALYAFNLKFTDMNNGTILKTIGCENGAAVTAYYVPGTGYYEAKPLVSLATKSAANAIYGLNYAGNGNVGALKGNYLGNGVAADLNKDTARTGLGTNSYRSTNYFVAVNGDFVSGQVHIGATNYIGEDLTFVTVGKAVDVVKGTADFTGLTGDGELKLGDTAFELGYAAPQNNGWLAADADVSALIGEKVDYTTANGVVIAIAKYEEPDEEEAPELTSNPYNKDYLVLNFASKVDFKSANVTLNADGTITLATINPLTAEAGTVTVNQINGIKLGNLINTFGFEVASNLFGWDGYRQVEEDGEIWGIMPNSLEELIFNYINNLYTAINLDTTKANKAMGIVAVANKTGDVYDISSDIEFINIPAVSDLELEFTNYKTSALSNTKYEIGTWDEEEADFEFTGKYLTVTAATKYIVIGTNGVEVIKDFIPNTGDKLVTTGNTGVLAISNDLVVIYSMTADAEDICQFTNAPATSTEVEGKFFTLTWKTEYTGVAAKRDAEDNIYYEYTFTNVRNLKTGANETLVIATYDYLAAPATTLFEGVWKGTTTPIAAANLSSGKLTQNGAAAQADLYTVYYIDETIGAPEVATAAEFAEAFKYEIGTIEAIASKDPNTLLIRNADETKTVNIVVSYTFDQYKVAKDDNKDNIKTAQTCNNIADADAAATFIGDEVLYTIDETGVCYFVTGLVFAAELQ